jgi:glucokinase
MFKHTAAIGIDIGRFLLKIGVVNFGGEIIAGKSFPLDRVQSKDYIVKVLVKAVGEIRAQVAAMGINPICIGISAKGFVDHQTGTVLGPDQGIKGWTNVPLTKTISRHTGLPVYVGNDANLMTIAEHRFGAARNFNNIVFISLRTTGIGGGIIINGKLYRGVNNAGGEIGQMIISFHDGLSDKGIRGSFEHFACANALVKRYGEILKSSDTGKRKLPSCKDIFELSYRSEKAAVKAVNENAEIVGIGLANLIAIFAPEIIVVGGGMAEAKDTYLQKIRKSAFENSLENCRSKVRIERARLGLNASVLGSAYYSMIRLAGKSIY